VPDSTVTLITTVEVSGIEQYASVTLVNIGVFPKQQAATLENIGQPESICCLWQQQQQADAESINAMQQFNYTQFLWITILVSR
jgi:hypothetical protein